MSLFLYDRPHPARSSDTPKATTSENSRVTNSNWDNGDSSEAPWTERQLCQERERLGLLDLAPPNGDTPNLRASPIEGTPRRYSSSPPGTSDFRGSSARGTEIRSQPGEQPVWIIGLWSGVIIAWPRGSEFRVSFPGTASGDSRDPNPTRRHQCPKPDSSENSSSFRPTRSARKGN